MIKQSQRELTGGHQIGCCSDRGIRWIRESLAEVRSSGGNVYGYGTVNVDLTLNYMQK
jgi:hypothetical protein